MLISLPHCYADTVQQFLLEFTVLSYVFIKYSLFLQTNKMQNC